MKKGKKITDNPCFFHNAFPSDKAFLSLMIVTFLSNRRKQISLKLVTFYVECDQEVKTDKARVDNAYFRNLHLVESLLVGSLLYGLM